jgi:endonuclease/exonuclease/phosphatase (EEP) superfamily protein YafD
LLAAAGALACAFTVSGFLGFACWVFDETSHFRMQYALALVALAAIFAAGRRFKPSAIFAGFAIVNLAVVVPYCFLGPAVKRSNALTIRLLQINVRTENHQYDLVKNFIRQAGPDVLIVEEVDESWIQQLESLRDILPAACSAPRDDNFGIALFSRLPLTNASIRYFGTADVPSVTAELNLEGTRVLLLGSHPLPPGSAENARLRNEQLEALAEFVAAQTGPLILVGDLNTTPWSSSFRSFVRKSRLVDSGRGFGYQTTWPAGFGFLGIQLDHCLTTRDFRVVDRKKGPVIGSDHQPLLVELQFSRVGPK